MSTAMTVTKKFGQLDWFITALAPILWGTMPAVATIALAPGHPLLTATVRSLGAGLCFLLWFHRLPPKTWQWRIALLGTVNIAMTFALFFVSASLLTGGIIAVLMVLSPFWATILSWPLLGERPKAMRLLLVGIGIIGVALIVGASTVQLNVYGLLAGVGASACMGCGIVLVKKWGRPTSILEFTQWQLLVGGLLLIMVMFAVEKLPASLTAKSACALAYLALASTALAYTLWFRGIERLGAQRTSMLLMLVPVTAFIIDVVFLRKELDVFQGIGVLVVLFCLFLDSALVGAASLPPVAPKEDK